jgi:DNA-binding MarR family transcriptional regulator
MPPGESEERYLALRTLFEMDSTYDAIEDVLAMHFARYGLSRAKFSALMQLRLAGDTGLTQSELGKKMLVSRANITTLIERLEKDNLVVRSGDPADKRAFRVHLTERAASLLNHFLPIHNDFVYKLIRTLNKTEKETLISLLQKLKKGLDSI